jgi:hypothetical protein
MREVLKKYTGGFEKVYGRFFAGCGGAVFAIAETDTIGVSPPVFCLC